MELCKEDELKSNADYERGNLWLFVIIALSVKALSKINLIQPYTPFCRAF